MGRVGSLRAVRGRPRPVRHVASHGIASSSRAICHGLLLDRQSNCASAPPGTPTATTCARAAARLRCGSGATHPRASCCPPAAPPVKGPSGHSFYVLQTTANVSDYYDVMVARCRSRGSTLTSHVVVWMNLQRRRLLLRHEDKYFPSQWPRASRTNGHGRAISTQGSDGISRPSHRSGLVHSILSGD